MDNTIEINEQLIELQYMAAMKNINDAKLEGAKVTFVAKDKGSIYPEVAEKLAEKGYDVIIKENVHDDIKSENIVYIGNSDGRRGKVKIIEVTDKNIDFRAVIDEVSEEAKDVAKKIKKGLRSGAKKGVNLLEKAVKKAKEKVEDMDDEEEDLED